MVCTHVLKPAVVWFQNLVDALEITKGKPDKTGSNRS